MKKTNSKITEVNSTLPVITLNANKLNSSVKRHKWAKWITHHSTVCCLQETQLKLKITNTLEEKDEKRHTILIIIKTEIGRL